MFNNLRKFLREGVSHNKQSLNSCFCSLITAFVLVSGVVNIARADVCFLPDSKGCEMVPYEEYGGTPNYPKNCFATKEEAMNARTAEVDSYYQNGNMWCIKPSCPLSAYPENERLNGGWTCDMCNDAKSINQYRHTCSCWLLGKEPPRGYYYDEETCESDVIECEGNSDTYCEASDNCHICKGTGQYSGLEECKEEKPVEAHCPEGYVSDEPAGGCYSTQDMLCGEGKCYKATKTPECGEGKRLAKANGVCSCVDDGSKPDYTPCDNGIWYAGNCVRYFHLRMDSDLHCYKNIWSDDIKVDGKSAKISDIDSDWAVIPEGSTVTADFEMLDQYKDQYDEGVCKNNGMTMRGHNNLTDSELDLNSKLTEFLAQSKISFIADDSHFNYVGTIPWDNDRDEILLELYDNDYPDSGISSSEALVGIYHEDYHRNDRNDVECKRYYFIADNVPELSNCYVALRTDSKYRGWGCDWAYFNGLQNNGCLDICNDDGAPYSAGNISGTLRCDEKDIGEISRSKSVIYNGIKIKLEQDD